MQLKGGQISREKNAVNVKNQGNIIFCEPGDYLLINVKKPWDC